MPALVALLQHIVHISPPPSPPTAAYKGLFLMVSLYIFLLQGDVLKMPVWMQHFHDKIQHPRTNINIKLFICKLIVNTQQVRQLSVLNNHLLHLPI